MMQKGGHDTYNEDDLKPQPGAVCDEPSPFHILQTDRIDKRREETRRATEQLKDGDALSAMSVWEELDEESYI